MSRTIYGWDAQGDPILEQMMDDAEILQAIAEGGGSSMTSWEGVISGACMNGDPNHLLTLMQAAGVVSPTPTNIGITVARCAMFRLPAPQSVANLRWYGVGATTAVYHMAIYQVSDRARLTGDLNPNTTANAWNAAPVTPPVVLAADTLYAMAVSVDTIGTTPGILACGPSLAATAGQIAVMPTAWPGSLKIDAAAPKIDGPAFAQFAVTAGVLPATAPVFSAPAAWTGGMPAVFMDSV